MKKMIFIYLIALSVSPAFALGEGARNLILINLMYLSPILFVTNTKMNARHLLLLAFMLIIFLVPPIFHPESLRWSTLLYTEMFCSTYLAISSILLKSRFTPEDFLVLLKRLLYAYFIVLLIQQFCVLFNLPIFNVSHYSVIEPWKLNSLTSEPSHSVRYVALFMYCYLTVKEIIMNRKYVLSYDLKQDKFIWFIFLWIMVTSISATAYLFILLVLMKFLNVRRFIPLVCLFLILIGISVLFGITVFERSFALAKAALTGDVMEMVRADHSGSARIAPMIVCIHFIDLSTLDGWFGKGIDFISTVMYLNFPGVSEGYAAGGVFLLFVEYGAVAFFLFMVFSFVSVVRKGEYSTVLFWIFLCLNEGLNSQIVWTSIIFLWMVKYYLNLLNLYRKVENSN